MVLLGGSPDIVACARSFRRSLDEYIGVFFLSIQSFLYVDIEEAILAIEYCKVVGYRRQWLERDSALVYQDFSFVHMVPWSIRGRWKRCLNICKDMEFRFSYFYVEKPLY